MEYIYSPEALLKTVETVRRSPWAAVDTEADSLHHYIEKLCLVQISVPEHDFVIDPLAKLDLKPLVEALGTKPLLLHGADFDVRMLRRFWGLEPTEIFDTMLAAQLLGYEKQGLADLGLKHCGVVLPKAGQKADWSRRPLDRELLVYAANDTHYLKTISDNMKEELTALGRLEWHSQTCARLLKSLLAPSEETKSDPRKEWQIKGSRQLKGMELTYLRAIWYWREEEARRRDRPSFKVLNGEVLIDIARAAASHPGQDVTDMPKMPRNVRGEHREALNKALQGASQLSPLEFFEGERRFPRRKWGNTEAQKLIDMKAEREKKGLELKIHPSLLATNAVLESLASEPPATREAFERIDLLMPWQKTLMGDVFLKILNPPKTKT